MMVSRRARAALIALACILLAGCTQTATTGGTAVSTYSGNLGAASVSEADREARKAKREAARARALQAKEERRAAFEKAREDRRAERVAKRGDGTGKTVARSKSKRTAKAEKKAPEIVAKARKSASVKPPAKKAESKAVKKSVKTSAVQKVAPVKASYAAAAGARVATAGKPWDCVPGRLKAVLGQVARKYGRVTINSTNRSRVLNRKVGGKRGSYHLKCAAVDFRVNGSTKGLIRFLANHDLVGGYKRYASGYYHIDTGPKRTW